MLEPLDNDACPALGALILACKAIGWWVELLIRPVMADFPNAGREFAELVVRDPKRKRGGLIAKCEFKGGAQQSTVEEAAVDLLRALQDRRSM